MRLRPGRPTPPPQLGAKRHTVCPWALLVLVVAVCHGGPARGQERRAVPASVPGRLQAAAELGAADPDATLRMSLTLRLADSDALDRLIADQQRPGSADYRRWLTTDEFAARFAPPVAVYAELVAWLQQQGFTVSPSPARLRVDFTGTVRQAEAAFAVHMRRFVHRQREVLANVDVVSLPARFADLVGAARLNTFPLAHPALQVMEASTRVNTMAPDDMYTAYAVAPVLDGGIDGGGQTIAVVARSDFLASDVAAFQSRFGVAQRAPVKVFPAANPGIGSPNFACAGMHGQDLQTCLQGEEVEVVLDTEWAGAMAPGASVLVDISDRDIDASLLDVVNNHPEAKIVSISFGVCERLDASAVQTLHPLYAQAAVQGQTVLVASGDNGPDECADGGRASVNALASDPNVTAVGGTALDPAFDAGGSATGYAGERVWNDAAGASGGGASALVAKPAYQSGPGVPADGARDLPDVALLASPHSSGYIIVVENQLAIVGGTSVATPSWAGVVALLNTAGHADGLGALNYPLYDLARRQFAGGGAGVFHDVTVGDTAFNGLTGFAAAAGFDLATGWGSPVTDLLVQAFSQAAATATDTPLASPTPPPTPTATLPRPCPGDCSGDGRVTVADLVALVDMLLGETPVQLCPAGDRNRDGTISVGEIIAAIDAELNGCPG